MKNFKDFITYANSNIDDIVSTVSRNVKQSTSNEDFSLTSSDMEFITRSEIAATLKLLEMYHSWISSE